MVKELDVLPECEPGVIRLCEIPKYQYSGTLKDELSKRLTNDEAIALLEEMMTVRVFEESIAAMRDGKFEPMPGFKFVGATHLSAGQEAVAIGGVSAINPGDYITSSHRGHGHSIGKVSFALRRMTREQLADHLGRPGDRSSREGLLEEAIGLHLYRTYAELFGKEDGYCRGRGGSMHIAEFRFGHLGANAIVGGSIGIATGAALACEWMGTGAVVLSFFGDGAASEGIFHECAIFASMRQFERGAPVIFLIENNQYCMTGQDRGEVTGVDYLAQYGAAYNADGLHAEVVDGMNVLAVRDAVLRAAQLCRDGKGPVLLECETYRYYGHSLSDARVKYRSRHEEEAWRARDPVAMLRAQVQEAGLLTADQIGEMQRRVEERVHGAAEKAARAADPDPAAMCEGLLTDTTSEGIGDKYKTVQVLRPARRPTRDSEGRILQRHAVLEALMEEMQRDRRVILFGEDVAEYGGAFQVTAGLFEIFGRERVFNTVMGEAAIVGAACGMAMVGLRPVCEIMYIDFILLAGDQVGNQVAKTRYMFGGKATIPLVIRTTIGGGRGYAGQHSQSLEAFATQFPGLKVVAPSTAYDVKGLLKASIRDDNPVVFIEHQLLYTEKGPVPADDYTVPIGVAAVQREGKDVTIVAYSYMAEIARQAAERLQADHGISAEVVDPRTLVPLDVETIVSSVRKTGRVLCLCQAPKTGCFAEHIAHEIQLRALDALKAPIAILAAQEVPPPMSQVLEQANLPNVESTVKAVMDLMRR
jgi:2-oxoisovalerate dehydrogenase E1 component